MRSARCWSSSDENACPPLPAAEQLGLERAVVHLLQQRAEERLRDPLPRLLVSWARRVSAATGVGCTDNVHVCGTGFQPVIGMGW